MQYPNDGETPTTTDGKGRRLVGLMVDRELLEEIAHSQRQTQDLVEQFLEAMQKNPMLRMMAGKMSG